jgi:hypothetical protein
MKLDIILRTCQNPDRSKKKDAKYLIRVCGNENRELMVLKCITSLIQTINVCELNDIKLTVLDDNSTEIFLNKLKKILNTCNKKNELINLQTKGPNDSAYKQFEIAANCEDMVYIIEDDYLHEEQALKSLIIAYNYLTTKYNNEIVLYPYDCAGRYDIDKEYLTILLYDGIRYWRQIRHTAFTVFCHSRFIKNNFKMFEDAALMWPNFSEDDNINLLYQNYETGEGKIKAFSPLPSVAYHLSFNEPAEIKTDHLSWRHLWERIKIENEN